MLHSFVDHTLGLLHAIARLPQRQSFSGRPRVRFCYPDFGAATRYRVDHQREQALLAGLEAEAVPITDGRGLYDLSRCDLLYLYRMPLAPRSAALLAMARLNHIPVIFDSDDLVWDQQMREYEHLDRHYDAHTIARILRTARRTALLMRHVSAIVTSTSYLAERARLVSPRPVYVNQNAVSREMVQLSLASRPRRKDGRVLVGYFSGYARVHDEDVASIAPVLRSILMHYTHVTLRIYGELSLPEQLRDDFLQAQIERRAALDWRKLPQEIAQVDLQIAPLIDNPQRRSKSAVKYLEAGLCAVPTVASQIEPYSDVIRDGFTSLLAKTALQWEQALTMMIERPELRERMGYQAREHILAEHTTQVRTAHFGKIVSRVVRGDYW